MVIRGCVAKPKLNEAGHVSYTLHTHLVRAHGLMGLSRLLLNLINGLLLAGEEGQHEVDGLCWGGREFVAAIYMHGQIVSAWPYPKTRIG